MHNEPIFIKIIKEITRAPMFDNLSIQVYCLLVLGTSYSIILPLRVIFFAWYLIATNHPVYFPE